MSFVGTRPEVVKYVKKYKPEYFARRTGIADALQKMYTIQAAFAESLPADVNSVSGEVLTGKSSTAHA